MKIDYVVTYLDPTDSYWQKAFLKYSKNEMIKQPARYDVDGVQNLKYHFRGLAKYLKWIDNVYLVVFSESQVPKWINRNTVKIITDDMYIPKKFLPTFNTSTKEMYINDIPGLEEHYIVDSDDIFSLNELSKMNFFDSNWNPTILKSHKRKCIKPPEKENWPNIFYNSVKFANKLVKRENSEYICEFRHHVPHPYLKSQIKKWFNDNIDEIEQSITPCRCAKNIIGLAWCTANQYVYSTYSNIKACDYGNESKSNFDVFKLKNDGYHFFNLNKNDRGDFFTKQFEQLFPEKCKYEI